MKEEKKEINKFKWVWPDQEDTWQEKLYDFFVYTLKLYKVRDAYIAVKQFPRRFWRVIRYFPEVYYAEPYDYGYLLRLLRKTLGDREKFFSNGRNVWMAETNRKKIYKQLKELNTVIDRIVEDEYDYDKYLDNIEHPTIEHIPIEERPDVYRLEFKFSSKEAEKLYNRRRKQYFKQYERRYAKDVDRFGELMKNFNNWWD